AATSPTSRTRHRSKRPHSAARPASTPRPASRRTPTMRGYPFEIRRVALCRFDGATPEHPPIYLAAHGDKGAVVDSGMIDRATPETAEVMQRMLNRVVAQHAHTGPHRFTVLWHRSPSGPHARLFRAMQRDAVPA